MTREVIGYANGDCFIWVPDTLMYSRSGMTGEGIDYAEGDCFTWIPDTLMYSRSGMTDERSLDENMTS